MKEGLSQDVADVGDEAVTRRETGFGQCGIEVVAFHVVKQTDGNARQEGDQAAQQQRRMLPR